MSVSGNDLMLNYTAVPEPATWTLLAGAVAGLAFVRRRARRKAVTSLRQESASATTR